MEDKFKVGDRIEYVAGHADHEPERVGKAGTIDALGSKYANERRYGILWDDGHPSGGYYREANIRPLRAKVTQAEIDDALSILREAGNVTFKPHKPPFDPVIVTGVPGYSVMITDKHVKVGCKIIEFSVIDKIAMAVAKARAYHTD